MIEIIILFIIIIVAAIMMRGRGLAAAKIDKRVNKRRPTPSVIPAQKIETAARIDSAAQKTTKIKWRPQVQVREYYKDGTVADAPAVRLND